MDRDQIVCVLMFCGSVPPQAYQIFSPAMDTCTHILSTQQCRIKGCQEKGNAVQLATHFLRHLSEDI